MIEAYDPGTGGRERRSAWKMLLWLAVVVVGVNAPLLVYFLSSKPAAATTAEESRPAFSVTAPTATQVPAAQTPATQVPSSAPESIGPEPDSVAGWPTLKARPPSAEAQMTSAATGHPIWTCFTNDTDETITISWENYDHQRVAYATLKPGLSYMQATYAGHVWLASRADGSVIALYTAAAVQSRVIVSDGPNHKY